MKNLDIEFKKIHNIKSEINNIHNDLNRLENIIFELNNLKGNELNYIFENKNTYMYRIYFELLNKYELDKLMITNKKLTKENIKDSYKTLYRLIIDNHYKVYLNRLSFIILNYL